jgi:hypothetical protein
MPHGGSGGWPTEPISPTAALAMEKASGPVIWEEEDEGEAGDDGTAENRGTHDGSGLPEQTTGSDGVDKWHKGPSYRQSTRGQNGAVGTAALRAARQHCGGRPMGNACSRQG